jgi:hypothetical protein
MMVKIVALTLSLAVAILLSEIVARLLLNPADLLSAEVVQDSVLGITVAPNTSGFDEWGFRNKNVPSVAEVIAIGDSHTYGNTAAMEDAWPAVVTRQTGLSVYNLGLGGYGPNQYYHLLTTKGITLHPRWVVCGLYMGDDFENAFLMTYGLEHWSYLRQGTWKSVDANIWGLSEPPVWGAALRNWLSEHSMVYRLIIHGPLFAMVKEAVRFKEVAQSSDPYTTALIVEEQNIREAFRPMGIAERLDERSGPVREGMRITFRLLKEMDEVCRLEGCRFLVVIIPTKESVFAEHLETNPQLHLHDTLMKVIASERSVKGSLVDFLSSVGISYLDTLPALKQSANKQLYAQTTRDMHPSKNGYRVIGEAVSQYISSVK